MTQPRPFTGFPEEGIAFLRSLARHNNREWFTAHRDQYEEFVLNPALSFVAELGGRLGREVPGVAGEPRVGGSLFRINRDQRFFPGEGPYKTHVGMRIRHGEAATSRCTGPLFYVEIDPTGFRIGVGIKAFDPPALAGYRRLVGTPSSARPIRKALDLAARDGRQVTGDLLLRVPAGTVDGPTGDLLKRKGVFIVEEQASHPPELHQAKFVDFCVRWFRPYFPFFTALQGVVATS